jgi:hypothetical protein
MDNYPFIIIYPYLPIKKTSIYRGFSSHLRSAEATPNVRLSGDVTARLE